MSKLMGTLRPYGDRKSSLEVKPEAGDDSKAGEPDSEDSGAG